MLGNKFRFFLLEEMNVVMNTINALQVAAVQSAHADHRVQFILSLIYRQGGKNMHNN